MVFIVSFQELNVPDKLNIKGYKADIFHFSNNNFQGIEDISQCWDINDKQFHKFSKSLKN